MTLVSVFLNPQTHSLRGGWRALVFIFIVALPYWASHLFSARAETGGATVFATDFAMIFVYGGLIAWLVLVSWLCLFWLERLGLAALGYARHQRWLRDVALGLALGVAMMCLVVLLQALGGGARLRLDPDWLKAEALVDLATASLALLLAAAFEELLFRGYAFQTLLRGAPALVPIGLLSLLFGLAHWSNPNGSFFSTLNTVLAGLWLAVAYLKTRSLWLPTALHFAWNWTMGVVFGLPISGMPLQYSLFVASEHGPLWLTGGAYGCEGGVAATLAFVLSTWLLWRARWLAVSPQMRAALAGRGKTDEPTPLRLNEPAQ
jgi:hypothetical protein